MFTEILFKILATAAIVLTLSLIAERVSARIAGLLTGAPLGALIVFSFLAREKDGAYFAEAVPHGLAGLIGTLAFAYGYHLGCRGGPRLGLLTATLGGMTAYAAATLPLRAIDFTLVPALLTALTAIAAAAFLFRRIENVLVARAVRLTPLVLAVRAGLAALLVTLVIALAEWGGPVITGLLVGFPMTLLPTYLIVHATYGAAPVSTMIRNFPLGLGGLISFLLVIRVVAPAWGPYPAIALGVLAAVSYLAALSMLMARRQT